MIYRAKCLGITTLKNLPTIGFRNHLDEYSTKFQILKMKLSRIDMSFNRPKCISCLIVQWFGDGYKWRVYCLQTFQKKKRREIFPLLSHFSFHIWNISNIACQKKSLKLNFSLLTNSNLIEFMGKCLEKLLIWNSYKWTTVGAQNSNRNAVFPWKILQIVFLLFQVSLILLNRS